MNSFWLEEKNKQGENKKIELDNTESKKKINHKTERNKIDKNYTTSVCVIGAGLTGLSTAYYLAKEGKKVIVVDKDGIGEKASGHTTAKITMHHGLIYDYLLNSYGIDYALKYYESNKHAIENIKQIIKQEKIKCDLEEQANYIYTTKKSERAKIEKEVSAINALEAYSTGKRYASLASSLDLPFKTEIAIKTSKQAQFHPVKYMLGLAKAIEKNNGKIFTNSCVKNVKKSADGNYTVEFDKYKIKAKYVVIATHYPFINFPGLYFSKMYQATSYAIAIETKEKLFDGMYLNASEPVLSFRTIKDGDKRLLMIGGGNHKTGFDPQSNANFGYDYLEKEAKKLYPDCKILYKWNTRDCITLDKIPYIGEFSKLMPNVYVATGYNKWGMTTSNVAANIIKDSILQNKNEYASVYNSTRINPIKNRKEVKNMVSQVVKSFVTNRIKIPEEEISAIEENNGGIIKIDGQNIGIYKDEKGNIYAVNPTCTHLGCLLTWNNLDKTWDCPCHGSRFDYTGKNLYDPAFKDLVKYRIE
ncbi:MAG: FAD-dependent oxidoreductase [Clostridia bacterium]|nr:FAD-dependent oxidoreductase [Clostridia bacterium]